MTLKWYVNDRCNLSCPFCLIDGHYGEMTMRDKERCMDKAHGMGVDHIDFFGKEPLVDDGIFRLYDYAEEKGYGFRYSLITNGMNLPKYKDDIVKRVKIFQVTVSYDFGVSRQSCADLSLFSTLMGEGIHTEVSVDLQKDNMHRVLDLVESGAAESYYIKPIMPKGSLNAGYASSVACSFGDVLSLLDDLEDSDTPSRIFVDIPFGMATRLDRGYEKVKVYLEPECSCGGMMFLMCDGEVYGCGEAAFHGSSQHCGFLSTPASEIRGKTRSIRGRRECRS